MKIQQDSNIGQHVSRLNNMTREMQKISADSFTPDEDIYKLATDIMLEANKIREITSERSRNVSNLHPVFDNLLNLYRI